MTTSSAVPDQHATTAAGSGTPLIPVGVLGARGRMGTEVVAAVKDTVGTSIEVHVVDPETLARSVGKIKRLYDHRDRA